MSNRKKHIYKASFFVAIMLFCLLLIWSWYQLDQNQLFDQPKSTILLDRNGHLLSARIAEDEQWRFPKTELHLPMAIAVMGFEDHRFLVHKGIDPLAIARALYLNIKQGKIVSGGSTISMQVIRMAHQNNSRTILQKLKEIYWALLLECRYSKKEILELWINHAPFGGNVVGASAAAWRYFGRELEELRWSELCALAVLPNNPKNIHLGRNRSFLKTRRDKLLKELFEARIIDSLAYQLNILEPLPTAPQKLPMHASHLIDRARADGMAGTQILSTLDENLQIQTSRSIDRHIQFLKQNEIHNAAALILDINNNEILAYVGNSNCAPEDSPSSDMIRAARSSGSVLKPLLYAAMMDDGMLYPQQLVSDIPTHYQDYSPKNFIDQYSGAVPADLALSQSLNIPAVRNLDDYGLYRFHKLLQSLHFNTINQKADHYGLSLILGGAEIRMDHLAACYASLARSLNEEDQHKQQTPAFHQMLNYSKNNKNTSSKNNQSKQTAPLSKGSIYFMLEALTKLTRPDAESGWQHFSSSEKIAWKTGTSFGYRDAWSIGLNRNYLVAVWVGNADGEGRPGLIGTKAAAPIMFELFDHLPDDKWFDAPLDDLKQLEICNKSGYQAQHACPSTSKNWIPASSQNAGFCPFHKVIWENTADENSFASISQYLQSDTFFILPPMEAYYYRQHKIEYKSPIISEVNNINDNSNQMEFVHPRGKRGIHLPVDMDGAKNKAYLQIAHRDVDAKVYWHLDGKYLGQTESEHEWNIDIPIGLHALTATDQYGNSISKSFEVY